MIKSVLTKTHGAKDDAIICKIPSRIIDLDKEGAIYLVHRGITFELDKDRFVEFLRVFEKKICVYEEVKNGI